MIDPQIVEKIRSTAQIVEVVQDYLTLRKAGQNFIACCPFHSERTPSFTVSPTKNIFKCFSCGIAGNPVTFIMEHEKISYVDALKILAKKYNITIVEKELTLAAIEKKNERENMFMVLDYAARYFQDLLHNHTEGVQIGKSYFEERSFSETIMDRFQLGYSLNTFDAFTTQALRDGYKEDLLVKVGLTIAREGGKLSDRFWGRVIFPIHSVSGRVIGFGGRTLRTDKNVAKYLNSSDSEVYHKGDTLFGLFFAKKSISKENKCFLVEGYTDVLSLVQSDVENVVATSGTALTVGQIEQIRRFTENVTIIYDGDTAGVKASFRGIDLLFEHGMNVRVVPLPENEDPDSLAKKLSSSELKQYIAQYEEDFITFKVKILLPELGNDPIKKGELIQNIVDSIALIGNNIMRSLYVQSCAELLNVDEPILLAEVDKIRKQRLINRRPSPPISHNFLSHSNVVSINKENTPTQDKYGNEIEALERELIGYLLRFGNVELFDNQTVSEFIISEIIGEELTFSNPMCQKIFEEYLNISTQVGLIKIDHFAQHSDKDIAAFMADMLTQKYTPSKMWEAKKISQEEEAVSTDRAMQLYKRNILLQTIDKLNRQLEKAEEQEVRELLLKIEHLNTYKVQLNKSIGRVIG